MLFNKDKTTLEQYPIGNSATSYVIPDSVKSIGSYAFRECTSLTTIEIPDSVKSIDSYTFFRCTGLTSVEIPNSMSSIGNYAFYYCKKLTDVYYSGTEEQWNKISIESDNECLTSATIHYNYSGVPASGISASKAATSSGVTYSVTLNDIPVGTVVIVALYQNDIFVGFEKAVYNGNTLTIPTAVNHDKAHIVAWTSLNAITPVAEGLII